jgi:hypothetical protein
MTLLISKVAAFIGGLKPSDLRIIGRWLDESKHVLVAIASWVSFSAIAILVAWHAILELMRNLGF